MCRIYFQSQLIITVTTKWNIESFAKPFSTNFIQKQYSHELPTGIIYLFIMFTRLWCSLPILYITNATQEDYQEDYQKDGLMAGYSCLGKNQIKEAARYNRAKPKKGRWFRISRKYFDCLLLDIENSKTICKLCAIFIYGRFVLIICSYHHFYTISGTFNTRLFQLF